MGNPTRSKTHRRGRHTGVPCSGRRVGRQCPGLPGTPTRSSSFPAFQGHARGASAFCLAVIGSIAFVEHIDIISPQACWCEICGWPPRHRVRTLHKPTEKVAKCRLASTTMWPRGSIMPRAVMRLSADLLPRAGPEHRLSHHFDRASRVRTLMRIFRAASLPSAR